MDSMFTAIVAKVLYPTKQLLLDVSNMMAGSVSDLVDATATLMQDLEDVIEKVIVLLTG